MQNHYVISSKYHFWTRNVPNWTKSPDLVMSGPVQEDPYGPHMGPYGPQPGPGPNPDWAPTRPGPESEVNAVTQMLAKTDGTICAKPDRLAKVTPRTTGGP